LSTLLIGGNGFTGHWLAKILENDVLHIIDVHKSLKLDVKAQYYQNNMNNQDTVTLTIEKIAPKEIYFLAGIMGDYPLNKLIEANVTTLAVLLDACYHLQIRPRILIVSSGSVYGRVKKSELPISENLKLNPTSNYGISKFLLEKLVEQYQQKFDIPIVIVRPSNLIGPGLNPDLLPGKIVKQVTEIRNNIRKKLELYNLEGERDYIDVRDAVQAYSKLMKSDLKNLVVNISTGNLISVKEIISLIESILKVKLQVTAQGKEIDPLNVAHSQDPTLLHDLIGFTPIIPTKNSIHDMLNFES
jgi:GDP-4-dehydro-6-deoxy-D-mannose reductase